jgi:hypothetical protein
MWPPVPGPGRTVVDRPELRLLRQRLLRRGDQRGGGCGTDYTAKELPEVGLDSSISLGCGNP